MPKHVAHLKLSVTPQFSLKNELSPNFRVVLVFFACWLEVAGVSLSPLASEAVSEFLPLPSCFALAGDRGGIGSATLMVPAGQRCRMPRGPSVPVQKDPERLYMSW